MVARGVSELVGAGDIPGAEDVGKVGAQKGVGVDGAARAEPDAELLQAAFRGPRAAADGDEDGVEVDLHALAAALAEEGVALPLDPHLAGGVAGEHPDPFGRET